MILEENLSRLIKQKGITQKDLAEKIGVTQKDISRWENGTYTPSLDYLVKICRALEVSADELLGI